MIVLRVCLRLPLAILRDLCEVEMPRLVDRGPQEVIERNPGGVCIILGVSGDADTEGVAERNTGQTGRR